MPNILAFENIYGTNLEDFIDILQRFAKEASNDAGTLIDPSIIAVDVDPSTEDEPESGSARIVKEQLSDGSEVYNIQIFP